MGWLLIEIDYHYGPLRERPQPLRKVFETAGVSPMAGHPQTDAPALLTRFTRLRALCRRLQRRPAGLQQFQRLTPRRSQRGPQRRQQAQN